MAGPTWRQLRNRPCSRGLLPRSFRLHSHMAASMPVLQRKAKRGNSHRKQLKRETEVSGLASPTCISYVPPRKNSEKNRLARRIEKKGRKAAIACATCYNIGLPCVRWELKPCCSRCTLSESPCIVPSSVAELVGKQWQEALNLASSSIEDDGFSYTIPTRSHAQDRTDLTQPSTAEAQAAVPIDIPLSKAVCGVDLTQATGNRTQEHCVTLEGNFRLATSEKGGLQQPNHLNRDPAAVLHIPDSQPQSPLCERIEDDATLSTIVELCPLHELDTRHSLFNTLRSTDYDMKEVSDSQEQCTKSVIGSSLPHIFEQDQLENIQVVSTTAGRLQEDSALERFSISSDSDEDLVDFLSDTDDEELSCPHGIAAGFLYSHDQLVDPEYCVELGLPSKLASSDCVLEVEGSSETNEALDPSRTERGNVLDEACVPVDLSAQETSILGFTEGPMPFVNEEEEERSQALRLKRSLPGSVNTRFNSKRVRPINSSTGFVSSASRRQGSYRQQPVSDEVRTASEYKNHEIDSSSSPVSLCSTLAELHDALKQPSQTVYDGLCDEDLLAIPDCVLEQNMG